MFTKAELNVLGELLSRVGIKGSEAYAVAVLLQKIRDGINAADTPADPEPSEG